jgi:predicted dehydrogenase
MSEPTPLRAAVVGMGKLGLLHAGIFNVLPGSRLVAAVDTSEQVLRVLQSKANSIACFKDHSQMLNEMTPDLVVIATPTGLHTSVAADCVRHGAHIFIEKPLCLVPGDAKPLLEALRQRSQVNMVGYMTRFLDTFRKAKELVSLNLIRR